ncbi:MAG: hypothetical protein QNJ87_15160 [Gammaproteobacteria bacterium]|nr:hypothetical protein [Gammaproteobacteria bacterium]
MPKRRYVMQDQIRNRVVSIMAHDPRHPQGHWRGVSRDLLLTLGITALYILALAATA